MTLGDIIKKYRVENNLSMDDFVKLCGLSKAYISILERGYNPSTKKPAIPSISTIKAVSSAVGIDFNTLLEMLDPTQQIDLGNDDMLELKPTTVTDDGLWNVICADEKKLMLARWISTLNHEQLQLVERLLDAALLSPSE